MKKTLSLLSFVVASALMAQNVLAFEAPNTEIFNAESKMRVNGQTYLATQVLAASGKDLIPGTLKISECYNGGDRISMSVSASGSNTDYISYGRVVRSLTLHNGDNNMDFNSKEECSAMMDAIRPDNMGSKKVIVFNKENNTLTVNNRVFNLK